MGPRSMNHPTNAQGPCRPFAPAILPTAASVGAPGASTWKASAQRSGTDFESGAREASLLRVDWPELIGEILTHLGLDPQSPPRSKAREAGLEFAA